jgi:MYXO-CTERM domain-containing protein
MRPVALGFLGLALTTACVDQVDDVEVATQEIVGGTATQITTVPWQVSLQSAQGSHFCGGSIVTPTWIMTAAHCVAEGAPGRIVAGISQISQSASGQIRQVKRVVTYPGYSDPSTGKDAALIELTTPLQLDGVKVKAIKPITSTSPATLTAPGVMTTVSGWGTLTEGAQTLPDQLQSVSLPIVANTAASTAYNMTITADQLAAGVNNGGQDSCQGDSGGPLVIYNGSEPMLAGIVSWGEGCARAGLPGLYARMASFAGWADGYAGGPPTAAAGNDLSARPGTRVTVDGSASADTGFGSIKTYAWRQVSGAPITLDNAAAATAAFTAPSATGNVELELTVTDEGGASATDRVLVTISANGGGGGGGTGEGGDDEALANGDVVGGCSVGGGSSGFALVLLALGLLIRRRK